MQKITLNRHIAISLSFILLASSAMAMEPADENGKTLIQRAAETRIDKEASGSAVAVTQEGAREDGEEEVNETVTRSWWNLAWITRGPTYEVKVRKKKAAQETPVDESRSTSSTAVPPVLVSVEEGPPAQPPAAVTLAQPNDLSVTYLEAVARVNRTDNPRIQVLSAGIIQELQSALDAQEKNE